MQQDELRDSDHARSEREATDIDVPASADSDEDTRIEVELDLDNYVLEWFQAQGENYEDLMNQVLRDYIEAEEAAAASQAEPDADGS